MDATAAGALEALEVGAAVGAEDVGPVLTAAGATALEAALLGAAGGWLGLTTAPGLAPAGLAAVWASAGLASARPNAPRVHQEIAQGTQDARIRGASRALFRALVQRNSDPQTIKPGSGSPTLARS